ncbi:MULTISPECIES: DUF2474 family protein [Agrobacterium]|nr:MULTISPECIES: DUF2474 family protein [Agrobacterium]NTJ44165.1 DUF2474 family protein [Agrobacterium larrymoorei]WCK22487.1 DUF2474 family protein [Agrobacterium tumefaciens]
MPTSLSRRLLWFIGIWLASVLGLTVVAYAIRLMIMGGVLP